MATAKEKKTAGKNEEAHSADALTPEALRKDLNTLHARFKALVANLKRHGIAHVEDKPKGQESAE